MASSKPKIAVCALDLPEHERVILTLIFEVARRSSLRQFAYTLTDAEHADVVVRDPTGTSAVPARPVLLVTDAAPARADAPVILRPLIATRVLTVLDDVCAQRERAAQSPPLPAAPAVELPAIAEDVGPGHDITPPVAAGEIAGTLAAMDDALLRDEIIVFSSDDTRAESAARRKRALVVDDSAAVRKQLEIELVHFDVDVDYAASARQAIHMLDTVDYDVAFLDVVLPDMDGYQICKRVKARNRGTSVIMLTGKATTEDKLKGTLAGCDAYMVKPVGRYTFQTTVKKFLALSAGARELKL